MNLLKGWNRNERLGLYNGLFVFFADSFMNTAVIITAFAARLGAPNAVIGLLPAIAQGGWMLPQLMVAAKVRPMTHKLPVYRSAALVRTLSYIVMIVVAATLTQQPALCLTLFILAMLVNALASGVSGLPFLEVVSKTVPTEHRARFFAQRNLFGGILAFIGGLGVRWILATPLAFPYNYALLFAIATVLYTIGYWFFGLVDEPADQPLPAGDFWSELRAIPQVLSDEHFRAFLIVRLLLAAASMGEPFFAVYALRDLHYPAATIGGFVMALTGVAPFSNIAWQRVAERKGSRRIIRYATFFAGLAPLVALLVGHFGWPPAAYLLVFMLSSVAVQGFNLGHNNHLLNIAPAEARSRYIGTLNTLVGVALFVPVIGGVIADLTSYRWVFGISVVLFAAAWYQCGFLRRDA